MSSQLLTRIFIAYSDIIKIASNISTFNKADYYSSIPITISTWYILKKKKTVVFKWVPSNDNKKLIAPIPSGGFFIQLMMLSRTITIFGTLPFGVHRRHASPRHVVYYLSCSSNYYYESWKFGSTFLNEKYHYLDEIKTYQENLFQYFINYQIKYWKTCSFQINWNDFEWGRKLFYYLYIFKNTQYLNNIV